MSFHCLLPPSICPLIGREIRMIGLVDFSGCPRNGLVVRILRRIKGHDLTSSTALAKLFQNTQIVMR